MKHPWRSSQTLPSKSYLRNVTDFHGTRPYRKLLLHWHNPSGRTTALGSTHLLTEMSTRGISCEQTPPVRKTDILTTHLSWYQASDRILPKSVVQYHLDYLGASIWQDEASIYFQGLSACHFSYVQIVRFHSNRAVNTPRLSYESQSANVIGALCSNSSTEHTNTLYGQNVEFMTGKPVGTWNHLLALTL
jgi:hypothetical protein